MDEKILSEGDSSGARMKSRKVFFAHLFVNDFAFLTIFFQGFNAPLDDFWPLIHSRRKNNLLFLNNLQVN